ncbi:unnamed protein product, partial [Meganyctiphanes norvegica]
SRVCCVGGREAHSSRCCWLSDTILPAAAATATHELSIAYTTTTKPGLLPYPPHRHAHDNIYYNQDYKTTRYTIGNNIVIILPEKSYYYLDYHGCLPLIKHRKRSVNISYKLNIYFIS